LSGTQQLLTTNPISQLIERLEKSAQNSTWLSSV